MSPPNNIAIFYAGAVPEMASRDLPLRPVTGTSNVGLWERTLRATGPSCPLAAPRDATANLIHRKDLRPSICIMAAVDRRTFAMWSGVDQKCFRFRGVFF